MDESKRDPPKSAEESEKSSQPTPSPAPSKEALAMIERAALAMADRRRAKRPAGAPQAQTPPVGPEPPEPFIVSTADMIVPRVSLKPPPAPPAQARSAMPPPSVTDKSSGAKLIAEFDQLVGSAPPRTSPTSPSTPEQISAIASEPHSFAPRAEPTDAGAAPRVTPANAAAALRPLFDDQFRLSPTRLQSTGIAAAIGLLVIGAALLTARTWTVAQDWSCRTGVVLRLCPPVAMPKRPTLPELPT